MVAREMTYEEKWKALKAVLEAELDALDAEGRVDDVSAEVQDFFDHLLWQMRWLEQQ